MKTNKAIDYAIIALRYWSEQTEMGKQVCNETISTLKTLREDETINVTLELSRDQLKKAYLLSNCKGKAVDNLAKTIFNEDNESVTISKEVLSAEGAANIITTLVENIAK